MGGTPSSSNAPFVQEVIEPIRIPILCPNPFMRGAMRHAFMHDHMPAKEDAESEMGVRCIVRRNEAYARVSLGRNPYGRVRGLSFSINVSLPKSPDYTSKCHELNSTTMLFYLPS